MTTLHRAKEILAQLVAFPTISATSNLDIINHIAEILDAAGARVDVLPDETGNKANCFATIGPEANGGIMLSGHTDVVPAESTNWTTDPFCAVERNGYIYGRGTCDMKGFIAAALAVAPTFSECKLKRPIHFAFTYDEEVGCRGGAALVETLRERGPYPRIAIVGEPTRMTVIEGHKGCYEYTTAFHGRAGHGSEPELGVNAIEIVNLYVGQLLSLRDTLKKRAPAGSRFDPPWTTINVGRITGGTARNVIAAHAHVEWEMRPVCEKDALFVKEEMLHFCNEELLPRMRLASSDPLVETDVVGEVPGLTPSTNNPARDLLLSFSETAGEAGLVSYGTEAGLFQGMGMSVAVCGPGSIAQAHKPDEFFSLEQLDACLRMLQNLTTTLEKPLPDPEGHHVQ